MARNLTKTMKAVGMYKFLPLTDPNSFLDLEINVPQCNKNQVLVQVKTAALNLVDAKMRRMPYVGDNPKILGIDGAGIVVSKGDDAKRFDIGDEVIFIADYTVSGTNAQYVALDECLIGLKSKKLTFEEAAAMTYAVATAYDCLFYGFKLSKKDAGKSILIINSAGGVGSAASQMTRNLGMKVIGTASRKETEEFSLKHGVEVVLNHGKDLLPQLEAAGYPDGVDYIMINFNPYPYWNVAMKAVKPHGSICVLVDSPEPVDIRPLKEKSVTLYSENMFTRFEYKTNREQFQDILENITRMVDEGKLKSTLTKVISPFNASTVRDAHIELEKRNAIGKSVLSVS